MEKEYKDILDIEKEEEKEEGSVKEKEGKDGAAIEANGGDGEPNSKKTGRSRRRNAEKGKKGGVKAEIISWLQIIAAAVVIAFVLNNFIIANSRVPSGSMEDTIMTGDRVIGSRLSYTFGEPDRGDIAIFRFGWICENCRKAMGEPPAPEICPLCGKTIEKPKILYYVKRVIGLPGDVVEIKPEGAVKASEISTLPPMASPDENATLPGAAVYVNGEKLSEDYLKEPMLYMPREWNSEYMTEDGAFRYEVPEGCYFMMGDNRNNSSDARFWNEPYIADEKIIAKVLFRYFPNPGIIK